MGIMAKCQVSSLIGSVNNEGSRYLRETRRRIGEFLFRQTEKEALPSFSPD